MTLILVLFHHLLFLMAASCASGSTSSTTYLSNWMSLSPLSNCSLLDLSLGGTHDTMTYDLSERVSEGGIDDYPKLAELLNTFQDIPGVGSFIQRNAQTQSLTLSEQLDAGVRFLDFRVMYTTNDWYCLHMVQSKQTALVYLRQLRAWLDAHPSEIVVLWLSKHGSQCKTGDDQYPSVSLELKQEFWKSITSVFEGLLFDSSESSLAESSLAELRARSQRIVIYASDYEQFTGGSTLALDGCLIDNQLAMSNIDGLDPTADLRHFAGHEQTRESDRDEGKFFLLSMANSPPSEAIELAAKIEFLPGGTSNIGACAATFHIPNFTGWCPATLLDVGQLTAYYHQRTLDASYSAGYAFPHAIYIDALTPSGGIRTGTRILSAPEEKPECLVYKWSSCETSQPTCDEGWTANGEKAHWNSYDYDGTKHGFCGLAWQNHYKCCRNADSTHAKDEYSYVYTLIAWNLRQACERTPTPNCDSALADVEAHRARNPLATWEDSLTARLKTWP